MKIIKAILSNLFNKKSSKTMKIDESLNTSKIIKLEDLLELSQPRTKEEILEAYKNGRFAEMTPRQAGLED